MSDERVTNDVGARFAAAAEARDAATLAGLYHPEGKFWNNVLGTTSNTEQVLWITRREEECISEYRFDNVRLTSTERGFVLQMTTTGTTASGVAFSVPACLVAQVTAGQITRIDEYVDAAQAQPIFEALLPTS